MPKKTVTRSESAMGSSQFRKWYRVALLLGNAAWRLLSFIFAGANWRELGQVTLLMLWPSVPYALLAWLVFLIKTPWILLGVTMCFLGLDVLSSMSMLQPTGSTAGLAAVFMPLWQLVIILPGGIALDWILRWAYRGFPLRSRDHGRDEETGDDEGEEDGND
jgi:hypothetical protein